MTFLVLLVLAAVLASAALVLMWFTRIFGHTAWLAVLCYGAIAWFVFGNLLKPVMLVTAFSDRLGAPYWRGLVLASFMLGAVSFRLPARLALLRGPLFVAVGMSGSLVSVGLYAEYLRSEAIEDFHPDRQSREPFLDSVYNAPQDFQFFLHGAAMKRCVPYAWSYRSMGFYRVPPAAARNVMPGRWLAECAKH